ncbi:hypothetical protein ACD591_01730 [Rufibacter glacialis]|uniref:STAS/SEC14 domain-containing protein n=1 Tax=Rufibacter glacialis TaxID=1259555 RepID=A0A5M8QLT9_9BACT|nr:hypothetical protein [Rufibacter glacialis]KAA6435613.1 hypothetical protein FOE74_06630 [Rufibacter glacialis]GGK64971.1 hypothetical protein GCM10011405_11240 [Rufibacter glacialis]
MIIYQSGLITLDYDPATDILYIEWPDVQDFLVLEIRQALSILVDHIKSYDIKKLLIDSSRASLEIPGDEYKEVLMEFGKNLMNTRLEKLARISTPNAMRENKVTEAQQDVHFTISLRTFTEKKEAISWLKGKVAEEA